MTSCAHIEWKWEYTFIWIAADRGAGEIIDFEVGDGSKATHLNLAFRL
ncbi:MAG: hypothetical protein MRQ10_06135 [Candidatus Midichloria mitochondrii]|nr:hypothetical protein [Candidatus Midichloria mitochondrii]